MEREKVVPKERTGERRFYYDKTVSTSQDLFLFFFLLLFSPSLSTDI
jgi:hypothetical protein